MTHEDGSNPKVLDEQRPIRFAEKTQAERSADRRRFVQLVESGSENDDLPDEFWIAVRISPALLPMEVERDAQMDAA